jgi:hypothetical protein
VEDDIAAALSTAASKRLQRWYSPGHRATRISTTPRRRIFVSVLIRFSPPSLTAKQYDEVVRRLSEEGVFPADGLDYEICFGSNGKLRVSQVWDSQQQLEAFGARLRPILADLGINPGEPEVVEVHNIIKR